MSNGGERVIAVGSVLAGRYTIEAPIGEGGMGAVFRARDVEGGSLVALKIVKDRTPEVVTRFLREARIAAQLRHPNVVTVHDVLELDDRSPAIVMELLHGETLGSRLRRVGRLAVEELAAIVLQVVAAIRTAHARGVVHRDLKPDNVFLCPRGASFHVTVLDFGIAKVTTSAAAPPVTAAALTRTGGILGSPHYMAPEQIFGEKDIDARADVWALGVILYEGLSGKRPFEGENVGQVFKSIALEPPRPLAAQAPWVPAEVAELVSRMLAHSREERLADLAEVTAVLAPFAESADVPAAELGTAPTMLASAASVPPKAPATSDEPSRRRGVPRLATVAVVACVAGASVIGLRARTAPIETSATSATTLASSSAASGSAPEAASVSSSPSAPSAGVESAASSSTSPSPALLSSASPFAAPSSHPAPATASRGSASDRHDPGRASSSPAPSDPTPAASHRSGTLRRDEF